MILRPNYGGSQGYGEKFRELNVESKLIVYKGFGHGITKPKKRLAALWHNWQWFNKYISEEDVELEGLGEE